jgi:hypothetical protein
VSRSTLRRLAGRLADAVLPRAITLEQALARRLGRGRPIPLAAWEVRRALFARLMTNPNVSAPPHRKDRAGLGAWPELVKLLAGRPLGGWAMESHSIAWVWACLHHLRPRRLLECGAGSSTLVLAAYAATVPRERGDPGACVISIEQSESLCEKVRGEVAAAGLGEYLKVVHVPVDAEGRYHPSALRDATSPSVPIQFLLIDGPFGPPGCRRTVLPALLDACASGATWLLDDALRSPDLAVVREWSRLPGVTVRGIVPVGQGMAVGRVA